MKRRLLQLCFALGLLLTLAVGTLWARGFWRSDTLWVVWTRDGDGPGVAFVDETLYVSSTCHGLSFIRRSIHVDHATRAIDPGWTREPLRVTHEASLAQPFTLVRPNEDGILRRLGFRHATKRKLDRSGAGTVNRLGSVPAWFGLLAGVALTLLPARSLRRDRFRRVRLARGLCVTCGYDLRGAEHARCPECGHPVGVAPGSSPDGTRRGESAPHPHGGPEL